MKSKKSLHSLLVVLFWLFSTFVLIDLFKCFYIGKLITTISSYAFLCVFFMFTDIEKNLKLVSWCFLIILSLLLSICVLTEVYSVGKYDVKCYIEDCNSCVKDSKEDDITYVRHKIILAE